MTFLNPRSSAEASDNLAHLTAGAAGLAALIYSINVVETFVSEPMVSLLSYGQIAGGLLILTVIGPMILVLKFRGGRPEGTPASGGFINALFRQATLTAFSLTLGFLILLGVFERKVLAFITAETAIDLVTTFALASFAVSFFIVNRFGHLDVESGEEL